MINKNKITLIISFVLSLLLITKGLSFAYFTANITNTEDSTTIYASGGVMNIHYDGGENINTPNIFPSNEPFATKNFTLTGKSTTSDNMNYHIMLVIEENTFTNYALQYKLTSTNTNNNGEVAPSIDKIGINTGSREIFLGNGFFESPADNKLHSYSLELYFPDTTKDQNEDMDKTFKAFVQIRPEEYICEECLNHKILAQYGGKENITEAPEGLFEQISTPEENAMYKMEDDYGMSYYYRGAKQHVKNNLIFAEHQWKIVRINGNGSIRIIYNGECPNNECDINDTGEKTQLELNRFNATYDDNKYIGYMYGGNEGVESTSYQEATSNEKNSFIKDLVDNWYEVKLLKTHYESYLSDGIFCNDREINPELHTALGFGRNRTEYIGMTRIENKSLISIICNNKNDSFTVYDIENGNGNLIYPIGLISMDELSISGLTDELPNENNYFYTGERFWTMTPGRFWYFSTGGADNFRLLATGNIQLDHVYYRCGIRPVLNLTPDTKVSGSGSLTDPFIVI